MKNEPDVHVSFFGNKTVSTKAILKKMYEEMSEGIQKYQVEFVLPPPPSNPQDLSQPNMLKHVPSITTNSTS